MGERDTEDTDTHTGADDIDTDDTDDTDTYLKVFFLLQTHLNNEKSVMAHRAGKFPARAASCQGLALFSLPAAFLVCSFTVCHLHSLPGSRMWLPAGGCPGLCFH